MATSKKSAKPAAKTATAKAVKEDVKKVETKAAEEKAETAAPAAEAPKKEEKPAAKKAPAAKAAKEPKATVVFQFAGKEVMAKEVLDAAVKAYEEAHKDAEIKTIELYVVAEEKTAYYVVNGEADPEFKIAL